MLKNVGGLVWIAFAKNELTGIEVHVRKHLARMSLAFNDPIVDSPKSRDTIQVVTVQRINLPKELGDSFIIVVAFGVCPVLVDP